MPLARPAATRCDDYAVANRTMHRQYETGLPELLDEPFQVGRDDGAECLWCGEAISGAGDGGSFFFLTHLDGTFGFTHRWPQESPRLAGHQFFCHVRCFRASVPEEWQSRLRMALDE